MFCSNVHSRVVDLMVARAATSTPTRCLPMLRSVYGRIGSSSCSLNQSICSPLSPLAESKSESGKRDPNANTWRINGAGAGADAVQESAMNADLPPVPKAFDFIWVDEDKDKGLDVSVTVTETKCSPLNLKPEFKPEPELDILVHECDENGYAYFGVHSVEEDGTCISPAKHIIQPPYPVREQCWCFRGISCNGLLYFQGLWDDRLLLNLETSEFKLLPPSQNVPLPPHTEHRHIDHGMWYDHKCEDYKLVVAVLADSEDEKGMTTISHEYHFDLYSLRSNSWKRIAISEDFGPVRIGFGACINGCFYTISNPQNTLSFLSLNLVDQTVSISPLPSTTKGFTWILDYKGLVSLLVSSIPPPFGDPECEVWPEYELWVLINGSWTKESTFETCGIKNPLFFSRSGRLLYFVTYADAEVVVFDRATGELKHLGIFKTRPVQFSRSFVKLNGVSDEVQEHEMEKYLTRVDEFLKREAQA